MLNSSDTTSAVFFGSAIASLHLVRWSDITRMVALPLLVALIGPTKPIYSNCQGLHANRHFLLPTTRCRATFGGLAHFTGVNQPHHIRAHVWPVSIQLDPSENLDATAHGASGVLPRKPSNSEVVGRPPTITLCVVDTSLPEG